MRRRFLLAAILVAIPLAVATARPSVGIILKLPPPDRYHLYELWQVTITNSEADSFKVQLKGTITEAKKGVVFTGLTKEFWVRPKTTKQLKYGDAELTMAPNYPTYAPGYREFAERTQGLPEGTYEFSVWLLPDFGGDSTKIVVKPTGPPRLLIPKMGDTIKTKAVQFTWTRPMPAPKGPVTYELTLVEVLQMQTPITAMRDNKPWFKRTGIATTNLKYDGPPLEIGKKYAWQVAATEPDSTRTTSEVWSFSYAEPMAPEPTVQVDLIPPPNNQLTLEHLWKATLTTTGGPITAYLYGYIVREGEVVVSGYSSNTLVLTNGTRGITSKDITGVRDLHYKEGYVAFTIRGGTPPAGDYKACLEVYDSVTNRKLGWGCADLEVGSSGAKRWWQCDKDRGHFWQGTEEERECPVKGCGGKGQEFEPPNFVDAYWDGDSLVVAVHVNQEMAVKELKVVVSWVSKDGRQAADAVLLRTYDPPEEHKLCDTLTVRVPWPSGFTPTGTLKPPAKGKLNLEKTKVSVLVNGQRIAENQLPREGRP